MKRRITSYIILGIGIMLMSNFSLVHAQIPEPSEDYCKASTICGTAPKEFTLMLDFVREMMNSIKTIGTEGAYLGDYIDPNRFEGTVFTPPPKQNVVRRLARNLTQKLKFTLAATAIFANPTNFGGFKDFAGGTALLIKSRPFLRDAKLIQTLESQVNDKKYELGAGGGWYNKVNEPNLKIMQTIVQKYIDNGVFIGGTAITDGVLYNNVTSLLTKILSSMKTFLYINSIGQFNEIERGGDNGVKVVFNRVAMNKIEKEYMCARGINNTCSIGRKTFKLSIKNIIASVKGGGKGNFVTVITDAVDRLVQTFTKESKQDEEFKVRKNDLMKSMYGSQKPATGNLLQRIARGQLITVTTDADEQLVGLMSDIKSFRSPLGNLLDKKGEILTTVQIEEVKSVTAVSVYTQGETTFQNILRSYVKDIFDNQSSDNALVSMAEIKSVTPAFTTLGLQVTTIEKDILGGKDKAGSLIKSLGEACELQCGRGGRCRK